MYASPNVAQYRPLSLCILKICSNIAQCISLNIACNRGDIGAQSRRLRAHVIRIQKTNTFLSIQIRMISSEDIDESNYMEYNDNDPMSKLPIELTEHTF